MTSGRSWDMGGETSVTQGEVVGMSDARLGLARDLVHEHVSSGGSPSVAAMVARRGQVVLAETAGVQGPDGVPLRLDHLWPIASASKPFMSALFMSLVEDGLVGINEPIARYLPELAEHPEVLIHHLLTHTTGWESAQRTGRIEAALMAGEIPTVELDRDLTTSLLLGTAFDPIRVGPPGELMDYDTGHYTLLSEIVRRVTGGTVDAAMRDRIIGPLGLERTALMVDETLAGDCVTRAPGAPFGPDAVLSFESDAWRSSDDGGSGLHLAPTDLLRFGQMFLDGGVSDGTQVLSPASVHALVSNRVPGVPAVFGNRRIAEANWGYGFTVVSPHPFTYFVGALVPDGSVAHPGAGGIGYWIDFEHEIVGAWFEAIAHISEFLEPVSGIGHRFQNVITAAAVA